MILRPSRTYLRASLCTLVTSGQVASITLEAPLAGLGEVLGRRAVGGEDDVGAFGNLVDVLDGDRALVLERPHDVRVVDDLVLDVDRRPELLQGELDDVDRPDNPRTKPARHP